MDYRNILITHLLSDQNIDNIVNTIINNYKISQKAIPKCINIISNYFNKYVDNLERYPANDIELYDAINFLNKKCYDDFVIYLSNKYPNINLLRQNVIDKNNVQIDNSQEVEMIVLNEEEKNKLLEKYGLIKNISNDFSYLTNPMILQMLQLIINQYNQPKKEDYIVIDNIIDAEEAEKILKSYNMLDKIKIVNDEKIEEIKEDEIKLDTKLTKDMLPLADKKIKQLIAKKEKYLNDSNMIQEIDEEIQKVIIAVTKLKNNLLSQESELSDLELFDEKLNVIEYLIKKIKINPETKNNNGDTILHNACASENVNINIIKYLIKEVKINPEIKNNNGNTSLHCASKIGNLDVVKYLIEEVNINPEIKNNNGDTILHYVSKNKNLDIVKYLIEEVKINPEIKNNNGNTPLHQAVLKYNSIKIVKYLVKNIKVNIETKNNENKTALCIAIINNDIEIIKYLINQNANINMLTLKEANINLLTFYNGKNKLDINLSKYDIVYYENKIIIPSKTIFNHNKISFELIDDYETTIDELINFIIAPNVFRNNNHNIKRKINYSFILYGGNEIKINNICMTLDDDLELTLDDKIEIILPKGKKLYLDNVEYILNMNTRAKIYFE